MSPVVSSPPGRREEEEEEEEEEVGLEDDEVGEEEDVHHINHVAVVGSTTAYCIDKFYAYRSYSNSVARFSK